MSDLFANSDLATAIISLSAMVVTIVFTLRGLRLQRLQVRNDYLAHVRKWAMEVVAVMSDCVTACELDPEKMNDFFGLRNRLRTRLSELIDTGRWFFENTERGEIGQWKERAFRGLAPEAVSTIKRVNGLIESLNYRETGQNPEKRQLVVDEKKRFVSEIQRILKPSAMAT